jgi:hypothetical protein
MIDQINNDLFHNLLLVAACYRVRFFGEMLPRVATCLVLVVGAESRACLASPLSPDRFVTTSTREKKGNRSFFWQK